MFFRHQTRHAAAVCPCATVGFNRWVAPVVLIGFACIQPALSQSPASRTEPSIKTCSHQEQRYTQASVIWMNQTVGQPQEQVVLPTEALELWPALRRIVPRRLELEVYTPPRMLNEKVLWCGGRAWTESLDLLLGSMGLRARIDAQRVLVNVADPAPSAKAGANPAPQASSRVESPAENPPAHPIAREPSVTEALTLAAQPEQPRSQPQPVQSAAVVSVVTESAALPVASRQWEILLTDRTVRRMLNRWASDAGWQRVGWEVPFDIQIGLEAKIAGTFEAALSTLAASLQASETPIEFVLYEDNRVVRVVKLQKGGLK